MLSYEYIRGIVEGTGTFTFSKSNGKKIPTFSIRMHINDMDLLKEVRDSMGLKNRIYTYHYPGKDGSKRAPQAILIVREFGPLKNVIIPMFYERLKGNKGKLFKDWIERIGEDPEVSDKFKFIHKIYKLGFYGKNRKTL